MNYKKETAIEVLNNLRNNGLNTTEIVEVLKEALLIHGVSNSEIADDKLPNFDLTDIIQFGYYVRKNPNVVMRENYLNWKEIPRDKPFSK
jgi:hypothetical protein